MELDELVPKIKEAIELAKERGYNKCVISTPQLVQLDAFSNEDSLEIKIKFWKVGGKKKRAGIDGLLYD